MLTQEMQGQAWVINLLATDFFFKFEHTLYLKCE